MFFGEAQEGEIDDLFPCFTTDEEDQKTPTPVVPNTMFQRQQYIASNSPANPPANPQRSPANPQRFLPAAVPYFEQPEAEPYVANPVPLTISVPTSRMPMNRRQSIRGHSTSPSIPGHKPFIPAVKTYDDDEEDARIRALEMEAMRDMQMIHLAEQPSSSERQEERTERLEMLHDAHGDEQELNEDKVRKREEEIKVEENEKEKIKVEENKKEKIKVGENKEEEIKEEETELVETTATTTLEDEKVKESEESANFDVWGDGQSEKTLSDMDMLFLKNTQQTLVPSKEPLPAVTKPSTQPLLDIPELWSIVKENDSEEKRSDNEPSTSQSTQLETNETNDAPFSSSSDIVEKTEMVEVVIDENHSNARVGGKEEASFIEEEKNAIADRGEKEDGAGDKRKQDKRREIPKYKPPSLSASTFEQFSVATTTPVGAKIVIEYVETGVMGRMVWSWPYREWPICAWLEFEFPDGRIEVFETRIGDRCIYMGQRRYQSEECQSLDLCREEIITVQQCLLLYRKCRELQTRLDSVHYDVICEYINTIPRYGKKFAEWWRQYVRKNGQSHYLTSHQLVFMVLAQTFPAFGADRLSAFYSISDFFEYIIELKNKTTENVVVHGHAEDEPIDPYAAASSSSSGHPCKEEV